MTASFHPASQCGAKMRFGSKKAAMHWQNTHPHRGADRLDAYRCPHCPWWHLGHRPPASKLAQARATGSFPDTTGQGPVS